MIESYILCEGFHDRALWAGLLAHLGAQDPGLQPNGNRKPVLDPWSLGVRGNGEYAFLSESGHFLRLVPAGGKDKIIPLARNRLKQRDQKALRRLVLMVDADTHADGTPAAGSPMTHQAVRQLIREADPTAIETSDEFVIDAGSTRVALIRWHSADAPAAGLPRQHTLERVVCAAVVAAYPERGPSVQNWLDSRPAAPAAVVKSFSWSYLAGWYAHFGGYEAFLTSLWEDAQVVPHLQQRLEDAGVWQLATALVAQ